MNAPTFEYSVYLRFLNDGVPGPLCRRYFHSASLALSFLNSIDSAHPVSLTAMVREVGTWKPVDRLEIERAAATELGR